MPDRVLPADLSLYELDETAWLEQTAELVATSRFDEVDREHLSEYLRDMARRDKREVFSRLVILLAHCLKWEYQPEMRTVSWQRTMIVQRHELGELLESATLRRYAEESLARAYTRAVERAVVETALPSSSFPGQLPWSLDDLLTGAKP